MSKEVPEISIDEAFDDFQVDILEDDPSIVGIVDDYKKLSIASKEGLEKGAKKYGTHGFYKFNMLDMGKEEVRDLYNYMLFEYIKYRQLLRSVNTEEELARLSGDKDIIVNATTLVVRLYSILCAIEGLNPNEKA